MNSEPIRIVRKSGAGIEYLVQVLRETAFTQTRVVLMKIQHNTHPFEAKLKIGRYNKQDDKIETDKPRSELTLEFDELQALVDFLKGNYPAFLEGYGSFIPIAGKLQQQTIDAIRGIFANPDKSAVLRLIKQHDILPQDILLGIQHSSRVRAVEQMSEMLSQDLLEADWQRWFKQNSWILGSDFVRVVDDRAIDTEHISDYLMQAYDGFLDLIEIKRPSADQKFWAGKKDHNNLCPSTELTAAISQVNSYLYEIERESNSAKFMERVDNIPTVKPRAILVFGRSLGWSSEDRRAYRILNSQYHSLTILTYDHVLERARRMVQPHVSNQGTTERLH